MDDEIREKLQDAADRIHYDPMDKEYEIKPGMGNLHFRRIYDAIDLLGVDLDEKRITKRRTANILSKALVELKEDTHNKSETAIEAFENQRGKILGEIFGSPVETYQIAFPFNLCQGSYPKDQINNRIKKLDYNDWEEDYYEAALDQDDTHFKKFLDESPNELKEHGKYRNSKFTYWITEYEARDPNFALDKSFEHIRLAVAKINYQLYKKNTGRRSSSNSPPVGQLSHLKEPFFYLVFQKDDYEFYHPMDYDLRRNCVNPDPGEFDKIADLPELPLENFDPENGDSVDDSLIAALFAYQDGRVASTPRQSFFAFWRGTENLIQARRGEKDEIVDRALAVRNLQHDPIVWKHIKDSYNRLYDRRNLLAHQGPHIPISSGDQAAAKLLLDALLEFYFERYGNDYTVDDYRFFFQQLAEQRSEDGDDLEQKKREVEIIEDMREYMEEKGE